MAAELYYDEHNDDYYAYDADDDADDDRPPWETDFLGWYSNDYGAMWLNGRNTYGPGAPFVNLSDFGIEDKYQRQGHGRRMLETVIEHTPGLDLTLEVFADNTPALRLYESLGFVETHRREGGWTDCHDVRRTYAVLYMTREDTHHADLRDVPQARTLTLV